MLDEDIVLLRSTARAKVAAEMPSPKARLPMHASQHVINQRVVDRQVNRSTPIILVKNNDDKDYQHHDSAVTAKALSFGHMNIAPSFKSVETVATTKDVHVSRRHVSSPKHLFGPTNVLSCEEKALQDYEIDDAPSNQRSSPKKLCEPILHNRNTRSFEKDRNVPSEMEQRMFESTVEDIVHHKHETNNEVTENAQLNVGSLAVPGTSDLEDDEIVDPEPSINISEIPSEVVDSIIHVPNAKNIEDIELVKNHESPAATTGHQQYVRPICWKLNLIPPSQKPLLFFSANSTLNILSSLYTEYLKLTSLCLTTSL